MKTSKNYWNENYRKENIGFPKCTAFIVQRKVGLHVCYTTPEIFVCNKNNCNLFEYLNFYVKAFKLEVNCKPTEISELNSSTFCEFNCVYG